MKDAGWYDDPWEPGKLRWWDGAHWTENVRENIVPPSNSTPSSRGSDSGRRESLRPKPPWLASSDDDWDDDFLEDDDFEVERPAQQTRRPTVNRDRPESLFEASQRQPLDETENRTEKSPPGKARSGPPIMERVPQSGTTGGEAPKPPWLRDREQGVSAAQNVNQSSNEGGMRTPPRPPWLRENVDTGERESGVRGAGGSPMEGQMGGGSSERPRPPWLRDSPTRTTPAGGAQNFERDRFERGRETPDSSSSGREEGRPRPDLRKGAGGTSEPRPASWEEMMEDFDDDEEIAADGERVKKFVYVGAGILTGVLLLFIVVQFFFSDREESQPEPDSLVELTTIKNWSSWPDPRSGYVVNFPEPPNYEGAPGTISLTSLVQKDGQSIEAYRVSRRFVDPELIASAGVAQRSDIATEFVQELHPGYTTGEITVSSLGGVPAREMSMTNESGESISVRFTLTENTLFVVSVTQNAEVDRFFNSFKWFREPILPPPPLS